MGSGYKHEPAKENINATNMDLKHLVIEWLEMDYAILYISWLMSAVFFVAFWTAVVGRVKRRPLKVLLSIISAAVILGFFVPVVITLMYFLSFQLFQEIIIGIAIPHDVLYDGIFYEYLTDLLFNLNILWVLLIVVASILISFRGTRKSGETVRSINWPIGKLFLAAIVSGVISVSTAYYINRGIHKELKVIASEVVADFEKMKPMPIPDEENAYPKYVKLLNILNDKESPDWYSSFHESDFDPTNDEVIRYLADVEDIMSEVEQASRMPSFYVEYGIAFDDEFPMFFGYQAAAKMFAVRAMMSAREGDATAAIKDIETIIRMAEHVIKPPMLITNLVADALYGIAIRAYKDVLSQSYEDINIFGEFPLFDSRLISHAFPRGIEYERIHSFYILSSTDLLENNGVAIDRNNLLKFLYSIYFKRDIEYSKALWGKSGIISSSPYYKSQKDLDELSIMIKQGWRGGLFSQISTLRFKGFYESNEKWVAKAHLANTATSIVKYRIKHNSYPGTLDALVPEFIESIPIDNFSGNPIKMKKTDKEIVLYSVGVNGNDDGGVYDSKNVKDDITFTLKMH